MRDETAVHLTWIDHDQNRGIARHVERLDAGHGMPRRLPGRRMPSMPRREHRNPLRLAEKPGQDAKPRFHTRQRNGVRGRGRAIGLDRRAGQALQGRRAGKAAHRLIRHRGKGIAPRTDRGRQIDPRLRRVGIYLARHVEPPAALQKTRVDAIP